MDSKLIRVGIAGYGRSGCDIHARWLRNVPDQFKIVAVADQLPERREDAVRDFNCKVYEDYHQLLENPDFDLFINSMPSYLHTKGTVDAFQKNLNVVCEKPLTRSVTDFDSMVAAATKAKRLFAPFQNSRFYPFFTKMREIIDSGILGEILHIRISYSGFGRRWDWQTLQEYYGGNLLNTGPHPMDHAIMLFGDETPQVFCKMKSIQHFGGDAEDFCTITLHGEHSPVIEVLISSYLAYPVGEQYNISGTYGGLTGGYRELKWKFYDPQEAPTHDFWKPWSRNREYCKESLPWIEESWKITREDYDPFVYNSKLFYENVYVALVNGSELVVKPREVRRQVAVIEECHRQNPLPKRK
ncbi:Gfo/Idh/MocA family oxidoreductase [candidate division KSB1 bacterium]|nr:Gfo/Idh/MocA family oxidoreductase [candidate division KSB1 bacterium]